MASKSNTFRPKALLPPTVGVLKATYAEYVACYQDYLLALRFLKKDFWDKAGRKAHIDMTTVREQVTVPSAGKASHSGGVWHVEFSGPVFGPVPQKKGEAAAKAAKPKPADASAKRLKRQRQRAAKRKAKIEGEISDLKLKTTLAKAKVTYSQALKSAKEKKTKATGDSKTGGPVKGSKATRGGLKPPAKGKGGPRDPPPPPPFSGPSGSDKGKGKEGAPPKGPEKDSDKSPNRKERRRAIYGPPASGLQVPVFIAPAAPAKVVVEAPKPAPFSFDGDTSDEEEEKRVPALFPVPARDAFAAVLNPSIDPLKPISLPVYQAATKLQAKATDVRADGPGSSTVQGLRTVDARYGVVRASLEKNLAEKSERK